MLCGPPLGSLRTAAISREGFATTKPTDVVAHAGKIVDWSVNAGSVDGQVQLRVLRPIGNGKYKVVHTSPVETINNIGINKFAASINVHSGDVLALSNDTSGIYMSTAPSGTCVRYFNTPLSNGWTGAPKQIAPMLHLLLSADVKS